MTTYYFKGSEGEGHPIEVIVWADTDNEAEAQLREICTGLNVECPMYLEGYAENGVYNACTPDEAWYGEEFEEQEEAEEEPLTDEELLDIMGDILYIAGREEILFGF